MNTYKLLDHDFITQHYKYKHYVGRIKDLPSHQKPREKLAEYGPSALTSQELLAIVLGTGTKKEEVLLMTQRVFREYGDKNIIYQTNPNVLARDMDIPQGKACQIVACFALGRRFFQTPDRQVSLHTSKDVYDYLKDMRSLPKEHLRGLYLNSRHQLVHDEVISIGTLTSNIIHPREVFQPAIQYNAVAIIIAHNHPSGEIKPTEADIQVTSQLIEAGKILGIDILDHIIIAKKSFTSIDAEYHV